MSIKLPQGFQITSSESIDKRLLLSSNEMLNMNDNIMPEKYIAVNKENGQIYLYDKSNSVDELTGKFRSLYEPLTDEEIKEICK